MIEVKALFYFLRRISKKRQYWKCRIPTLWRRRRHSVFSFWHATSSRLQNWRDFANLLLIRITSRIDLSLSVCPCGQC